MQRDVLESVSGQLEAALLALVIAHEAALSRVNLKLHCKGLWHVGVSGQLEAALQGSVQGHTVCCGRQGSLCLKHGTSPSLNLAQAVDSEGGRGGGGYFFSVVYL
jgi:hypothetical protein